MNIKPQADVLWTARVSSTGDSISRDGMPYSSLQPRRAQIQASECYWPRVARHTPVTY